MQYRLASTMAMTAIKRCDLIYCCPEGAIIFLNMMGFVRAKYLLELA